MSQTTTHSDADTLDSRELIVRELIQVFLPSSGNNPVVARSAAVKAINSFTFHSYGELISVVQIIALGMASIRALGLSMTDDASVEMLGRFQSNAVAMIKSEQTVRRILRTPQKEQRRTDPPQPKSQPEPTPEPTPEAVAPTPPQPEPRPQAAEKPSPTQQTAAPRTMPHAAPPRTEATPVLDRETFAAFTAFIQGKTDQLPPMPFGNRRSIDRPPAAASAPTAAAPTATGLINNRGGG